MKNAFIIYVISQLITTAYGLAVIESAKPFIDKELIDNGYHKNKNSLYKFNNTFSDILKGFIPFYYFIKALKITLRKGNVSKEVEEAIKDKRYITDEDEIVKADIQIIEDVNKNELENNKNISFEKQEKYVARKNDFSLLDTYETPIEYISRNSTDDDKLELSPFINNDKVVEQVFVKDEVTNKDIAKAICDLDEDELESLISKIESLKNIKKNEKKLKLEKDVA